MHVCTARGVMKIRRTELCYVSTYGSQVSQGASGLCLWTIMSRAGAGHDQKRDALFHSAYSVLSSSELFCIRSSA